MDKRILECMDELVHIYRESEEAVCVGSQLGIKICDIFTSNGIHIFKGIKDMAAASEAEIHTGEWDACHYVQSIVYNGVTFYELMHRKAYVKCVCCGKAEADADLLDYKGVLMCPSCHPDTANKGGNQ